VPNHYCHGFKLRALAGEFLTLSTHATGNMKFTHLEFHKEKVKRRFNRHLGICF